MSGIASKSERNLFNVHPISGSLYIEGEDVTRPITPAPTVPPKIAMFDVIRGWSALVLAVSHCVRLTHLDILGHEGRSSERLAKARRLLCWAFVEVAELDTDLSTAWLEQCLQLGHRSIVDNINRGEPPEQLQEVLDTYSRLYREMGPDDVRIAATAGIIGERRPRATYWPKGFLQKLGLTGW